MSLLNHSKIIAFLVISINGKWKKRVIHVFGDGIVSQLFLNDPRENTGDWL